MIGLTDAQFDQLEAQLQNSGLKTKGLYHDLLDHLYCLTERYVREGMAFEKASDKALNELAPEGFKSIENDLFFLLTFNFQIKMKRMLYLGGFLAAFGQSINFMCRVFNWPAGKAFAILGFGALLFIVVPILIFNLVEKSKDYSSMEKFRFVMGLVAASLMSIGSFFKVAHWNGANIQIGLGFLILSFIFLPMFFWQLYQKSVRELAV